MQKVIYSIAGKYFHFLIFLFVDFPENFLLCKQKKFNFQIEILDFHKFDSKKLFFFCNRK